MESESDCNNETNFDDLPIECVEQILNYVTDRFDKIHARFVCKLWSCLIDRDSSSECYRINTMRFQQPNNRGEIDFSALLPQFLTFQRKKISFRFTKVDFQNSHVFWREKGPHIVSLQFGKRCRNIPFEEIIKNCGRLQDLTVYTGCALDIQHLLESLEKCSSSNFSNLSVHFIRLLNKSIDMTVTEATRVLQLVGDVFPAVEKVLLREVRMGQGHSWSDVDTFGERISHLKFKIVVSNWMKTNLFVFAPSSADQVPALKLNSLVVQSSSFGLVNNTLMALMSHVYKNHLSELHLQLHITSRVSFDLNQIREILSELPALKVLSICADKIVALEKPPLWEREKQLRDLKLLSTNLVMVNDPFLQSFKYLKSFECRKLMFGHFVKLLYSLEKLERLSFNEGVVDGELENDLGVISNSRLITLKMPDSFLLHTSANYKFDNLKCLCLYSNRENMMELGASSRTENVYEHQLERIVCPNIKNLHLNFSVMGICGTVNQCEKFMVNILSQFPSLIEFTFNDPVYDEILTSDDVLIKLLRIQPRLKKIGHYQRPRILNIISSSCVQKLGLSTEPQLIVY